MFPNFKTDYFYLQFLYKTDSCLFCLRNDVEIKASKIHWTYIEITHVFHLSVIIPYNKKYFKIALLPLTKKVSLDKLLTFIGYKRADTKTNKHSKFIYRRAMRPQTYGNYNNRQLCLLLPIS